MNIFEKLLLMFEDDLTNLARVLAQARKLRDAYLPPELFGGEKSWDFLLALFLADAHGTRLTGRQLLERDGGHFSTGHRWIKVLTNLGLIVGDGDGRLDDPLSLTPVGLESLEAWLAQFRQALNGAPLESVEQ
jgi:hypothetical protein